ncbi:MAG: hypothetical protein ACNI28_03435 [Arcobacter sp.]|uniref:hypothetical protein n=1 Tax=Arcobacter sp. TaxID=1872629 RepID=UPI003B00F636
MSMSQEEIEALMNGLDISENENSENDDSSSDEKDSENMSENDIADLIAQTDLSSSNVKSEETPDTSSNEEKKDSEDVSNEDIDDLLNTMDENTEENSQESESQEKEKTEDVSNSDIDELLNAMDEDEDSQKSEPQEEKSSNDVSDKEIDELLNSVDEETNADSKENDDSSVSSDEIDSIINGIMSEEDTTKEEDVDTSEIDDMIAGLETSKESEEDDYLSGLDFNLDADSIDEMDKVKEKEEPTSSSNKKRDDVVNVDRINIPNQLGEVANDSEEKATKIFDALSYILDDNEELRKTTKTLDEFMQSQLKLLEMLSKKFPKVKEFSNNLETINALIDKPKEIQTRLHNRDKELFETMELMQFHDINRQKIERVMGLVINLSRQLNSIFDDESKSTNLPGANHLPGDRSEDLVDGDDLESLIAEFGK